MLSQIFLQVWVLGCVGSTVGYLCKYGYQGVFEVGYFYRYGYRAVFGVKLSISAGMGIWMC